jgi:hypothetical protein
MRRQSVEGGGDGDEQIGMIGGLGFTEEGLHLAPHHFDGIEVGVT